MTAETKVLQPALAELIAGTGCAAGELLNDAVQDAITKLRDLSCTGWVPVHMCFGVSLADPDMCCTITLRLDGLLEHIDIPETVQCSSCNHHTPLDVTDIRKVRIMEDHTAGLERVVEAIALTECASCDAPICAHWAHGSWFDEDRSHIDI